MTDQELVAEYRSGTTLKEIARSAGCKLQTVANRIAKLRSTHALPYRGKPLREDHPRRRLAQLRKQIVVKMHDAGATNSEIAEKVGLDEQYVHQLLTPQVPKDYDGELERLNAELAALES